MIEKVSKQSRVDSEAEKEASDLKAVISSHIGLIAAGQDIVVRRPSKEEWLVRHNNEITRLKMVSRKKIIQSLLRSGGYQVRCYPDAGRLEILVSFSSDDSLLQYTLQRDRQDSLVWTLKYTGEKLTDTWTCRTYRLRKTIKKKMN